MTMRTFPSTIEVNLDGASRSTIIAAACVVMSHGGARASDLGEWRQRAAVWDLQRITATSRRMRSQVSSGQSSLVAAATSKPLTLSPL